MTILYSLVETSRALWGKPLQAALEMGSQTLRATPWLLAHGGHELAAAMDLGSRINKSYEKPAWRLEEWGYSVDIVPIWGTPFGTLIRFKTVDADSKPKLLIVAPMSGHYPTLLRETVRELAQANDVFMTEWINPRDIPLSKGDFTLDDYADFLRQSFRELAKLDARPCAAMSVCQPTIPTLAAASMMWEDGEEGRPQTLVMIGGPIDARKSPTSTNEFASKHGMNWFEGRLISQVPFPYAGMGRRVYPGFLQHMGFVSMNPGKHAAAHGKFFESLIKGDEASAAKHREFYDEYNAVMDLPASYYLQTVKMVFKDFDLAQGRMNLCGRLVRPEFIKGSLLTIEGELDDISGSGQTHSAHGLCVGVPKGRAEQVTFEGVGHYGVFSGSSFKSKIAPKINSFIKAQLPVSQSSVKKSAHAAASKGRAKG